MKTTLKVIGAVFGLGAVILLGLQLFLQFGLNKAMREAVLPRIRQETGIDIHVRKLSLNLPQGRLYLKGVAVRNPAGFHLENAATLDRVEVELQAASLWKEKRVRVKNFTVQHAHVNVIRNEEGLINLDVMRKGLPKTADKDSAEERAAQKTGRLPEVLIDTLDCNARVRYVNYRSTPLDIAFDLEMSGNNLGTWTHPSAAWGTLQVAGSDGADRARFVADLHFEIAQVVDPAAPTFKLTGEVLEIDPRLMHEIYDDLGMRSGALALSPRIDCVSGVYENSGFALVLNDIELEGELANEPGGVATIDRLQFPVPLSGTFREPIFDVEETLRKALYGNGGALADPPVRSPMASAAGLVQYP